MGQCGPYVQSVSSTAYPRRLLSATPYTPALLHTESVHPEKTGCSPLCDPSLGLERGRGRAEYKFATKIIKCYVSCGRHVVFNLKFSKTNCSFNGLNFWQISLLALSVIKMEISIVAVFVRWSYCKQMLDLYLATQWWSPSAAWVWGRSWCGRAGSGTYGRSGAQQTLPGRPRTTGQTERCSVPSPSHNFPLMDACGTPQRDHYYAVKIRDKR